MQNALKILGVIVLSVVGFAALFIANRSNSTAESVVASADKTRELCRKAIVDQAKHPSTVDIHGFTGYATSTTPDGRRLTKQTFTAKNDYGLELAYDAYCELAPDGKFKFMVEERPSR
ncbi:hypothetical protein [Bradyrhizobium sp. USDA 4502]